MAIVVSHVLRGLASDDDLPRTSAGFIEIDDALYSWHVAVFAIVAGALLPAAVDRRGPLAYLRPRVLLFTYLYVLWTVLQAGTKQAETAGGGDPVDTGGFLQSFATAYGQLWWLAFMVLATVAAVAVRPWLGTVRACASTALVAGVAVASWGWTGPWVFEEGLALLLFFWVGMLAGRDGLTRVTTSGLTGWIVVVGLGVGVALLVVSDPMPPTSWLGPRTVTAVAVGVVTSAALCLGALALSGVLARTPLARILALLGQRSLEIFLGHILAIEVSAALLGTLGVEDLTTQVALGTVAGLTLPVGLWWLGRRIGFPWLFTTPAR